MGDVVEAVLQKLFPWMLDPMGKALQGMMVGAFSSTAGSVSYAEWNVAITAANRIGWVMGFVNMLICAVGAVHAAVKASPAESVKSFAMAVLAWPLTAICVSVMITCEGIVSLLSARILAVGADTTKGRGMESMVSAMFKKILEQASVLHSLTMLLVYLVLFVGVFLLCCMLAARTLCLVLLAAVAPLPVMSAGWKATRPGDAPLAFGRGGRDAGQAVGRAGDHGRVGADDLADHVGRGRGQFLGSAGRHRRDLHGLLFAEDDHAGRAVPGRRPEHGHAAGREPGGPERAGDRGPADPAGRDRGRRVATGGAAAGGRAVARAWRRAGWPP